MHRPKLIYLARRNPILEREQFVSRWRQHGDLGMSMPRWKNVWRYVHCDVLPEADNAPGVDHGHDGVGLVWHRSPETRRAHREDTSSQAVMENDERETFAEMVQDFCALYEEFPVVDCGESEGFKIFRFLKRRENISADEFRDEWSRLCADLVLRSGDLRSRLKKYVQNHQSPPEGRGWGLGYDLVEELWFGSIEDAVRTQADIVANGPLSAAIERSVSDIVTVITNEVVLYQVPERD